MTEITEQIPHENEKLLNVDIRQTVLLHQNNISDIYRSKFEVSKEPPIELSKTFSKPLIFYHQTEDTDHLSKINDLKNIFHDPESQKVIDYYTDDDAEANYLSSNPVSFLIIGKPDIGQTELGQLISENWKCVPINPETVLKEEIYSDTRAGKCIKYNLESGRSIGPEIVLRLVQKRLKSQSVQHRGYVLSGFPMLKNEFFQEDPISSESAIFNVQEIFEDLLPRKPVPDKPGSVSLIVQSDVSETSLPESLKSDGLNEAVTTDTNEENKAEEKPAVEEKENLDEEEVKIKEDKSPLKKPELQLTADLGPSDTTIVTHTEPFHSLKDPKEQLIFLQNLLDHPLVVIYVACNNIDVHKKREKYRFNVYLKREILTMSEEEEQKQFEDKFPVQAEPDFRIDGTSDKMQVKLPMHFKKSISSHLWQFKCNVHNILKQFVMQHNPQYFIKIDGKLNAAQMYDTIYDRLKMLSFQPVLIPERIIEEDIGEVPTDLQSKPIEELSPEESFKKLRDKMIISPMYKFQLSNWIYKCPVALKEGRNMEGKSEFAVRFMSKIFFLSSEEALLKFYRNPRNYLLPIMPHLSSRFWILGPKCSGRSVVAKCLSFLYNCKILDPAHLEMSYMKRKEEDYLDKIRSAAMTKAISLLNISRENERKEKIAAWKKSARDLLITANHFNAKRNVIPEDMSESEVELFMENMNMKEYNIQTNLNELCLPSLSQTSMIQELLIDTQCLLQYLPEELKATVEPATVFDSFVQEYVEKKLNTTVIPDMKLTTDEKVEMFKTEIDQAEEKYSLLFERPGGWIIDGMPLDMDILVQLIPGYLPDDVVCLQDEDPEHVYLVDKFAKKDFSVFKGYKEVFEKLKIDNLQDLNMAILSTATKINFIESILTEIEDRVVTTVDSDTTLESLIAERNRTYAEEINRFNDRYRLVRTFLTDDNISLTELNVENKSTENLLLEVITIIQNKYRKNANIMTDEDRAEEQTNYSALVEDLGEGIMPEGDQNDSELFFQNNRRLGITSMYCPVTFDRYFVLWKGKEQFSVSFEQQVYLLSSKEAMNEFVFNPRVFLRNWAPKEFPPPRICITGVFGAGKSGIAMKLSENYGLHYINFDELILDILNMPVNYNFEQLFRLDEELTPGLANHPDDLEMIKRYLENDTPMQNNIVQSVLSRLWFDEPYKDVGFVLDNFPRRPSDISLMTKNFLIPDIVIEFHASQEIATQRIIPGQMELFRGEINEKRRLKDLENENIIHAWRLERIERLQIMAAEKRQERKIEAVEQTIEVRKLNPTPIESGSSFREYGEETETLEGEGEEEEEEEEVIEEEEHLFVYDEIMEMEDLEEINRILDEEMPEPSFHDVFETEEETMQKILAAFDSDFARDIGYLDKVLSALKEENIDCAIIDTDNFTVDKVLYEVIRLVDKFKFRGQSYFERVYEITLDVADRLLEQGYYFISKFGRTCPIQVYDNNNPIQMYLPGESQNELFPCICKRYIYFLYGEENLNKFKNDPLKYITYHKYKFPLIPIRLSIIGPPKSGKTLLAKRFEKDFNMNVITRGSAIRHVLNKLPNSELAKNINFLLDRGWSATSEMVAKSVEILTMEARSLSQGYVMDGFPNTQQELNQLGYLGIVPHIIIDVQTSLDKIEEYSNIQAKRSPLPVYSFEYIKMVYDEWKRNSQHFRSCMEKEYQNVYSVENLSSKWHFWNKAKETVFSKIKEYHNYIIKKEYDNVLIVRSLCVTPNEFFLLQSSFMNYCPLCYYFDDYLKEAGAYPDRDCVFQYFGQYYYICSKHQESFIANPKQFIPPINEKELPKDLPKIRSGLVRGKPYQDGLCIVSFWDNQPKYVLLQGDTKFSVSYKGINYLFCTEYCMKKFMATPTIYFNKIINFKNRNPLEMNELAKLPTLGYLEQLTSKLLIKAVIEVEIQRPYFPGLSISTSAAILMAMNLKRNNPNASKMMVKIYDEIKEKLDERRLKLKLYLNYFKGRLNPFINYVPRHVPKEKDDRQLAAIESDLQKWLMDRGEPCGEC